LRSLLGNYRRLVWTAVFQFDAGAALRRQLVRQLTDKLAATDSN